MKNLQIILLALLASVITSASLANIEEGEYYIKNAVLQKYLQVTNSEAKAGANVEIGAGTGKSNQKWTLKKLSNGYVLLTSKLGDFSLDIANGKDEKGANVNIYYTHTGDAQQFHLLTSSNGNAVFIAPKTMTKLFVSMMTKLLMVKMYIFGLIFLIMLKHGSLKKLEEEVEAEAEVVTLILTLLPILML
jgi:hypothetical protein